MKTFSKYLFATLFLFHLCSCEKGQNSSCANNGEEEEFIQWFVNDETHIEDFDNVHVYFADDRMLYISAQPTAAVAETGLRIQYDMHEESAEYIAHAFNINDDFLFSRGSNLEMTVTEFSSEGDFICIDFDNGEFSGAFMVILNEIVESASVQGTVWLDENKNGLMEANESPLSNVELSLKTEFENLQDGNPDPNPNYYPTFSVQTDDNGQFTFNGVFVDHPIRVSFFTLNDPILSDANVGSNDSVDSDFTLAREIPDRKWYHTDVFTIGEGDTKDDIGLGIVEE